MRIRPYQTVDNKIDGAVVVLVDIDALKRSSAAITASRDYADAIIDTARNPLVVLDERLCVQRANRAFYEGFQVTPAETEKHLIHELGNRQWDIQSLRTRLAESFLGNRQLQDFEVEHTFDRLGPRVMLLNTRRLASAGGDSPKILLAIEDITERKRAEQALRDSEEKYRLLVESATGFAIIMLGLEGQIETWNVGAERLLGFADVEILGENFSRLFREEDRAKGLPRRELESASRREVGPDDNWLQRKDGSVFWASGATSARRDDAGRLTGFTKVVRDITERRKAEEALARSHAGLQSHAEELARFNRAAVGRELRMIALKKEVNDLSQRLGEDVRYPLDFEEAKDVNGE